MNGPATPLVAGCRRGDVDQLVDVFADEGGRLKGSAENSA